MIIVPIYRSRGPHVPAHCCPKCGHRFDEPPADWVFRIGVAYATLGFIASAPIGYLFTRHDQFEPFDGAVLGPMLFVFGSLIGAALLRGLYFVVTGK